MKTRGENCIQFDTTKFDEEIAKCRASQTAALSSIAGAIFKKHYEIDLDSPPELLRLALAKTDVGNVVEVIQATLRERNATITNEGWLKLFKTLRELVERGGPMSDADLREAREAHRSDLAIIQRWVAAPNHPDPVRASLCFYTWEAIAKIVYKLDWKKPVPLERQKVKDQHRSPEAERIKGQCRRLNLVQSELRLVKDVKFERDGTISYVPFKQHLPTE